MKKILKRSLSMLLALILIVNVCMPRKSQAIAPAVLSSRIIVSALKAAGLTFMFGELMDRLEIEEVLTNLSTFIYRDLPSTIRDYIDSFSDEDIVEITPSVMNAIISSAVKVTNGIYVDSTFKEISIPSTVDGGMPLKLPINYVELPDVACNTMYNLTDNFYNIDLASPVLSYYHDNKDTYFNIDNVVMSPFSSFELSDDDKTLPRFSYYYDLSDYDLKIKYNSSSKGSIARFQITGSSDSVTGLGDGELSTAYNIYFLVYRYGTGYFPFTMLNSWGDITLYYHHLYFIYNQATEAFGSICNIYDKGTGELVRQFINTTDSASNISTYCTTMTEDYGDVIVTVPDTIPTYTETVSIDIQDTLYEQLTTDVSTGEIDASSTETTGLSLLKQILSAINNISQAILDGIKSIFVPSQEVIDSVYNMFWGKLPIIDQVREVVDETVEILTTEEPEPPQIIIDLSASTSDIDYGGEAVVLDFSWYEPYKPTVDALIVGFVYIVFAFRFFHRLPDVISGSDSVADLISSSVIENNRVHDIGFGKRGTRK